MSKPASSKLTILEEMIDDDDDYRDLSFKFYGDNGNNRSRVKELNYSN